MAEERTKDIKESAEEIVESFAESSRDLPTQEETYYEQETVNVLRSDGEPIKDEELVDFRRDFLDIMPEHDEDGNLKVEVAEWTE